MRKAKYDLKKVICPNAPCIGFSSNVAKPGYWVTWKGNEDHSHGLGRVLGRIAETDKDGKDCKGYLAVIRLSEDARHAWINWIDPKAILACYDTPPSSLLAWITGADWVKSKADIARIIAMSVHGTLADRYIGNRDNPDQAYNARPEYIKQFILE